MGKAGAEGGARRGAAPFGGAESHARSAWSPPQAGGLRPVAAACRGWREKQNSHPRCGNGCGDLREVVRQLRLQLPSGGGKDGARVSGEELCGGAAAPCHQDGGEVEVFAEGDIDL